MLHAVSSLGKQARAPNGSTICPPFLTLPHLLIFSGLCFLGTAILLGLRAQGVKQHRHPSFSTISREERGAAEGL